METRAGIQGSKEAPFPSTFRQTAEMGKVYGVFPRELTREATASIRSRALRRCSANSEQSARRMDSNWQPFRTNLTESLRPILATLALC